jgi:hypothetical protein
MSNAVHSKQTPRWILDVYNEIDSLEFKNAFECFSDGAVLVFGTAEIRGVPAIREFFIYLDTPLITNHRAVDFWDMTNIKIVRGVADLAHRDKPDEVVSAPFVHIFQMSDYNSELVAHFQVVVGPIHPERGL